MGGGTLSVCGDSYHLSPYYTGGNCSFLSANAYACLPLENSPTAKRDGREDVNSKVTFFVAAQEQSLKFEPELFPVGLPVRFSGGARQRVLYGQNA